MLLSWYCWHTVTSQWVRQRFSQPLQPEILDALLQTLVGSVCAARECVLRNLSLRLTRPAYKKKRGYLCFWPSSPPADHPSVDTCYSPRHWTRQAPDAAEHASEVPPFLSLNSRQCALCAAEARKVRFWDLGILYCISLHCTAHRGCRLLTLLSPSSRWRCAQLVAATLCSCLVAKFSTALPLSRAC